VRISRTCIDTSYTRGRSRAERYTIPTMHLIIEAENVFFGLLVSMWALDMSMYIRNGDLGVLFRMIFETSSLQSQDRTVIYERDGNVTATEQK
jgi:hypothetical protein